MVTRNNIKSKIKPDMVEINGELVYERSNIEEHTETDPVFNTVNNFFTYDENQYSLSEWNSIKIKKLEDVIEILRIEIESLKGNIN